MSRFGPRRWVSCVLLAACSTAAGQTPDELLREGRYEQFLDETAGRERLVPGREGLAVRRLETLLTLGRYSEAGEEFAAAMGVFPDSIRLRWVGRDVVRFAGRPRQAEALFREIGQKLRTEGWRYRLDGENLIVIGRYLLEEGVDPKDVLNATYSRAERYPTARLEALLASAELAIDKGDFALAGEFAQQAARLDEDHADVQFALAEAFAATPDVDVGDYLRRALEINARHVPSLLMLAERRIDGEQYDESIRLLGRVFAVNPTHPVGQALRAAIAHVRNDPDAEEAAVTAGLTGWNTNPAVPFTIGRRLSRKYRFAEAAEYQRLALTFDADFLPARLALAQDELRLGNERRGWELAGEVAMADPYNVTAYNLATLHDQLDRYTVLDSGRYRVRMDPREAAVFGPRVLELLARAEAELATKYGASLPEQVFVDIYSRQEDFAIRTFGMPGGIGYLGVCFGPVVTMNSPSAVATPVSWESVLWHEFTHVVTLSRTQNRMPRWLSEGISVYEERLADARWGQQMTPPFRAMLLDESLLPLSELSRAFLDAESGEAVQLAYFQSSLAVRYIIDEFGFEALSAVLGELSQGLAVNDALQRHTSDIASLDRGFQQYARGLAEGYAAGADFAPPGREVLSDRASLTAFVKANPDNVAALTRLQAMQADAGDTAAALQTLDAALSLFGDLPPVDLLRQKANLQGQADDFDGRRRTLRQLAERSGDAVDVFTELMQTAAAEGDPSAAARFAEQVLAVNPMTADPYEVLSGVRETAGDVGGAVEAVAAIAELDPVDPAGVNFRLARLLRRDGRREEARQRVLLALEEAPRYRDAHRLLLELSDANSATGDDDADSRSGAQETPR